MGAGALRGTVTERNRSSSGAAHAPAQNNGQHWQPEVRTTKLPCMARSPLLRTPLRCIGAAGHVGHTHEPWIERICS